MLKRTKDTRLAGDSVDAKCLPASLIAARILATDGNPSIIVTNDEARADAVARLASAFAPSATVVHLVASDALPGDAAPPSAANVGQRVEALRRLRTALTTDEPGRVLLVLSAEASAVRYAPPAAFDEAPPVFRTGDPIDIGALPDLAQAIGYVVDDCVDEPGEIAIRGNVIDIFPADRLHPVRIEFVDGRITSLRSYDPITQLSVGDIEEVTIGRASEPALGDGVAITAHLPGCAVYMDSQAKDRRDRFLSLASDGSARRRSQAGLVSDVDWRAAIADRQLSLDQEAGSPIPRFVERRDPLRAFRSFARAALAEGKLVIAGSARDLRFLSTRLGPSVEAIASLADASRTSRGTVSLLTAPLEHGFVDGDLTVVAAADLLGSRAKLDEADGVSATTFGHGSELHVGDLIVHEDHGIGAVVGLEELHLDGDGASTDAIVLEYAKGARRLVPVAEAGRIWRYGADADVVTYDTLDGGSWAKRRAGIDVAIAESAQALQALAADRDARVTDPVVPDNASYEKFASGFAFTETRDQARAIAAVRTDLASGQPMDRLVVGDVGYGKTEVALRAAAMVALAGRQVAIVAPTTVLIRQHLATFRKRFTGTGLEVASLSRLSTTSERKRVCAGLADGSIAVVIGTSAVAGKSVRFRDLALVVIDEEQRFGAKAKTDLRAMGAGHVLTLSATPIPRTLQTAMVGLQALSIIATPPARRQPIRTIVAGFDDDAVRRALRRERARGGQSFVVVPRIDDIAPLADTLASLVPELGVVVAHGKMEAGDLDDAMTAFAAGDGDILLATNIIEAGLDVPRANTMIVHHADRFGLSQLHQLRGRVGRGSRRGQIMLLTEGNATIADATMKRLRALQAFDQLGAGFAISARDLDLRGAGDLVGEEQAGHMKLIGVDLYQHLLGQALKKAHGETTTRWQPVLKLGLVGALPQDWIPEVDVRLTLYSQLAHLNDVAALEAFASELEDRFGALPAPAIHLLEAARIGMLACNADIRQIDAGPGAIAFTPGNPKTRLEQPFERAKQRWLIRERILDPLSRCERIRELLNEIQD